MAEITIGLLYPGYSAEQDFRAAEQALGIRLPLVHTEMESDAHRPDELRAWGEASVLADGAAALVDQDPAAIVWTCTSGSFVFGWDGARQQAAELGRRCGVPASSTSLAFAGAAHALQLSRVVVAASYPADVAELFVEFLAAAGLTVTGFGVSDILYASDVGRLSGDEVVAMVRAADRPDAQAILVPDTAMHTLSVLGELEDAVGKPVLTANQVSVWEGLRLAGHRLVAAELGALFGERSRIDESARSSS